MATACWISSSLIARYTLLRQKKWMAAMQARIAETGKVLSSMKSVKLLGLESRLNNFINDLRKTELSAMVHYRVASVLIVTIGEGP